jgi:hypothetical protein
MSDEPPQLAAPGIPPSPPPQAAPSPSQPSPTGETKPASTLSPEEQMALFEQELKETDWGHQPC